MDEPVVHREEAVGLLFNAADIAATLRNIEELLEDGEPEEGDEG